MAQKPLSKSQMQEAVNALAMYGQSTEAAKSLDIPYATFKHRLAAAKQAKMTASPEIEDQTNPFHLRSQIARLRDEVKKAEQEKVTHAIIRSKIIGLKNQVELMEPPPWMLKPMKHSDMPGTPTVFLSDLHWAEVIDPKQINNVNQYNLEIANNRLKRLAERTMRLCEIISPTFAYPGIIVPLGGDMVSGNIHDELTATNEVNSMPTVLDLFGAIGTFIETLLTRFEHIFLPCVTGNHGRDTRKIWGKDRHATSFDWLLYCFLAKHFENNKRVTFHIPDGPDAYYKVYDHRYLLTHGDQFRGGDGMIGALGPILRGDHKKRSRNSQIHMEYDTLLMGHWHQLIQLQRLIVNGCFPSGTPVTMGDGTIKAIDTITIGETVVTRQGNKKKVVDAYTRKHTGDVVSIRCGTLESQLTCTSNHRVWAVKGSTVSHLLSARGSYVHTHHNPHPNWIEAGMLSVGDYIEMPTLGVVTDDLDVTPEFCRLLGFFLSEGSISGVDGKLHHIDFTFHKDEVAYADFVQRECIKQFGKAVQRVAAHRNTRAVVVHSTEAAHRMFDLCQKGAQYVRLRDDLMMLPPKKQKEILLAWLSGDGHTTRNRRFKQGIIVSGTSISRNLIEQMRIIALRCGYFCSINSLRPGGGKARRKHTTYSLLFTGHTARELAKELHEYSPEIHDSKRPGVASFKCINVGGSFFARITDVWIDPFEGDVFNLTVEDDHTYIANGVGVANSLKGYDEYAWSNNFSFEPPQQALWLTHPTYGITYRMPVLVDDVKKETSSIRNWVSVSR